MTERTGSSNPPSLNKIERAYCYGGVFPYVAEATSKKLNFFSVEEARKNVFVPSKVILESFSTKFRYTAFKRSCL